MSGFKKCHRLPGEGKACRCLTYLFRELNLHKYDSHFNVSNLWRVEMIYLTFFAEKKSTFVSFQQVVYEFKLQDLSLAFSMF